MMIDVHCHILTGLDDGPKSMEQSLEMCAVARADGIETIVASPHMLNDVYQLTREDILGGVRELDRACKHKGIGITILAGADIRVQKELPKILSEGGLMTVADLGQHVMLELPEETVPSELGDLLFEVQLTGVTPIISHPERNFAIQQDLGLLRRLVEAGNLTQITAGSLTGRFGSRVRDCSISIVQAGLGHMLASDAHDAVRRRPVLSEGRKVLEELVDAEEVELMVGGRARSLIEGKYVAVPEVEPQAKKGFFSFLASGRGVRGG